MMALKKKNRHKQTTTSDLTEMNGEKEMQTVSVEIPHFNYVLIQQNNV